MNWIVGGVVLEWIVGTFGTSINLILMKKNIKISYSTVF